MIVNRDLVNSHNIDLAFQGTAPSVGGYATVIQLNDSGIFTSYFTYYPPNAPGNFTFQKNSVNFIYFP